MNEHNCPITCKNKRVASKWLGANYLYEYKGIHAMKLMDLKSLTKIDLKVDMSLTQIRRAKLLPIEKFQGDLFEEYGRLWDYLNEIERSNPGSTTQLKFNRPSPKLLPIFERLYISFDCLKKGCLRGCRKIIGLDGCFLKGTIKGELLAAVGRDENNQMFPVAWSVVTWENKVTWNWFIQLLAKELDLKDGFGWTIITDQQKVLSSFIILFYFPLKYMVR